MKRLGPMFVLAAIATLFATPTLAQEGLSAQMTPTPTATPTPDAEPRQGDCLDFQSQHEAQLFYEESGGPESDPYGLDQDADGTACEVLVRSGDGVVLQADLLPQTADTRDCADFDTQQEAQDFFESEGGPTNDPHQLDPDKDGVACEGLAGAAAQDPGSPSPSPAATEGSPSPSPTPTQSPFPVTGANVLDYGFLAMTLILGGFGLSFAASSEYFRQ